MVCPVSSRFRRAYGQVSIAHVDRSVFVEMSVPDKILVRGTRADSARRHQSFTEEHCYETVATACPEGRKFVSDHGDQLDIEVISEPIEVDVVKSIAEQQFGDMVKAVVDVDKEVMAIGGELHADEEAVLLDLGSAQANLWGINLYPEQFPNEDWIEFDSMINLRPAQGNRSRGVEDPKVQEWIRQVVAKLVKQDG